jgi:Neuraminidase (sialidase)
MWLINSTDLEYNINGYEYRTYLEVEDDNQKLFHLCFKDGQQVQMPYAFTNHSPYSKVSKEEFLGYIRGLEFNEQIPF